MKKFLLFLAALFSTICRGHSKFYIESCSANDRCTAFLAYRVEADTKVSSVASMFGVDSVEILGANNYEMTPPNPEDVIVQAQELLRIPLSCACSDQGIRKADSIYYTARSNANSDQVDTLSSIAFDVFRGMVTPRQIAEANRLVSSSSVISSSNSLVANFSQALEDGQRLVIPFPCACNDGEFDGATSVFISYMVRPGDTLQDIAGIFESSTSGVEQLNGIEGASYIAPGDILEVPVPACRSNFDPASKDYGLVVANGTYAVTAGHCVQCSCGYKYPTLDCTRAPDSISSSCPAMQCSSGANDLNLGDAFTQPASAGCLVTYCEYKGFNESDIFHGLRSSSENSCPGPRPPPAYRQYLPALSPDASPIIEPMSSTTSGVVSGPFTPLSSPASSSPAQLELNSSRFYLVVLFMALVIV